MWSSFFKGTYAYCSGYMFEPRTVYKISNILLSTVNHYTAYTTYSNHNNTGMQLQSYHVFIYYTYILADLHSYALYTGFMDACLSNC